MNTLNSLPVSSSILIIGGAGYIGSHITRLLHELNYSVVVFDDLSRGKLRLLHWFRVIFLMQWLCAIAYKPTLPSDGGDSLGCKKQCA